MLKGQKWFFKEVSKTLENELDDKGFVNSRHSTGDSGACGKGEGGQDSRSHGSLSRKAEPRE